MRKTKRLVRELRQAVSQMQGSLSMDKFAIQNELVPIMLDQILTHLKKNEIQEVVDYLDDMHVTNDMVKEHLMGLSLKKDIQTLFDKVDTKTKSAFTRAYNKAHQKLTGTKKGKAAKDASSPQSDDEGAETSDDDTEVIDA